MGCGMKIKNIVLGFIALLSVGCATGPKYIIPKGTDVDNLAQIYIYRTDVAFGSLNPEKPFFYIDGKEVGKLGTGQSVFTMVVPGRHKISVKKSFLFMPGADGEEINLVFEPKEKYYLRYSEEFSGLTMVGTTAVAAGNSSFTLANKELFEQKK